MGEINPNVARRLKGHVMSQLDRCVSYGSWVCVNHPKLFEAANIQGAEVCRVREREGRLAWIDHMIAEFKKQGD